MKMNENKLEVINPDVEAQTTVQPVRNLTPDEMKILARCPACLQKIEKSIESDDVLRVVRVFKIACGFDPFDKKWDKIYCCRYAKPARELIEFIGNWQDAADAIQDISEKMKSLGRTFTLETIVNHAAQWKMEKMERMSKHGQNADPDAS